MAQLTFEKELKASADDAWKIVGSFDISGSPGVDACEVDGKVRTLTVMGGTKIVEKELERDDAERFYSYTITEGPFPLTEHKTTFRVAEDGDGSRLSIEAEFAPDALADTFKQVYGGMADALVKAIDG